VLPAASVKTKLPVHWAPAVYIIVPGWIVAEAAGAHAARGLRAVRAPAAVAGWSPTTAVATAAATRPSIRAGLGVGIEDRDRERVMSCGTSCARRRRGDGARLPQDQRPVRPG